MARLRAKNRERRNQRAAGPKCCGSNAARRCELTIKANAYPWIRLNITIC